MKKKTKKSKNKRFEDLIKYHRERAEQKRKHIKEIASKSGWFGFKSSV